MDSVLLEQGVLADGDEAHELLDGVRLHFAFARDRGVMLEEQDGKRISRAMSPRVWG